MDTPEEPTTVKKEQPTRRLSKSIFAQPGHGWGQKYIPAPDMEGYDGPGVPLIPPVIIAPPPVPGVPTGLEYLLPLSRVFIRQELELLDLIVNVEATNYYSILADNDQRIYLANENTECCTVCCCGGSIRPFRIDISDVFGRHVLHFHRPCNCMLYLTSTLLFCCGQMGGGMIVTLPDGSKLGEIVHKYNFCKPKYIILDEEGNHLMTILGPKCGDFCGICCFNVDFPVTSPDGSKEIGYIRKNFSGPESVQDLSIDTNNFGVEFPMNLNIKKKVLMLAAVFLIDFMYFEKLQEHKHHHAGVGLSGGGRFGGRDRNV